MISDVKKVSSHRFVVIQDYSSGEIVFAGDIQKYCGYDYEVIDIKCDSQFVLVVD